jgi:Cu-Zn family superoxide dismutase
MSEGTRWAAVIDRTAWGIALTFALSACSYLPGIPEIPYVNPPPPSAIASLTDASGRSAGQAVLVQDGRGVRLLLDVNGLAPGDKAVHFHEVGQCVGPSFNSAGAHFNPTQAEHGTKNPRGPHAGDLPDITVDAAGRGHLETSANRVSLKKGPAFLLDADGSAIVVHERADDTRSDPDGGSGTRIACGILIPAGKP